MPDKQVSIVSVISERGAGRLEQEVEMPYDSLRSAPAFDDDPVHKDAFSRPMPLRQQQQKKKTS